MCKKLIYLVLVLLVFALAVVAQARVNLQITEIYAGTSPKTPGGAAFYGVY